MRKSIHQPGATFDEYSLLTAQLFCNKENSILARGLFLVQLLQSGALFAGASLVTHTRTANFINKVQWIDSYLVHVVI